MVGRLVYFGLSSPPPPPPTHVDCGTLRDELMVALACVFDDGWKQLCRGTQQGIYILRIGAKVVDVVLIRCA